MIVCLYLIFLRKVLKIPKGLSENLKSMKDRKYNGQKRKRGHKEKHYTEN
jgi:hypothetical protein